MSFSALPSDWLVASHYSRFYTALHNSNVDAERWLFPGALSLLIGAIGLLSTDRKSLKIALLWIGIGFAGSLGLHFVFHRFLFSHVPGFRAIRVPARWAAIAYVGLAMLVAIGTAMIARRQRWAYALIALAFIVELRAAPILWFMARTDIPPVAVWIREHKPRAIIELPIRVDGEYDAMLRSTVHHRPMVNGISGFAPPEYDRLAGLAQTWSDKLVAELQRIGVTHVVVHADDFDAAGRAWLRRSLANGYLAFVRRFDSGVAGDWLFTIGGSAQLAPELDAMLRGLPTRNESTFGRLESPQMWERVNVISGFAFSPYRIREVNVLVNNGAIRLRTALRSDGRFFARFRSRPPDVWQHTDIQTEIIDGKGNRLLLDDRFVEWP